MEWSSENCRNQFIKLRKSMLRKIERADSGKREEIIIDNYNDVCLKAVSNDPIAQDLLAYIFKKGFENVIPVNYEKYMQWEILAAGSGNNFAIDKLSLFLNVALNEIMFAEDFGYILVRNELNNKNYNYIVGKLICEAIADELRLVPEKLIKDELRHQEFEAKIMRTFDRARKFAIPKVLKFLRS
ncbi:MAG: hypothetical protein PHH71_00120 [Clostridia bacterium]|jgi:hypothetical protein|nr:hypothetical protein [Clostridia bacterium]MDD3232390.1 hypothetical protein [Clostridia bacterium]MDD3862345.1 hypothetical protein [Clostridia bacterium]MDD4408301.1 hypothetical protein [Clostridia bacterium]